MSVYYVLTTEVEQELERIRNNLGEPVRNQFGDWDYTVTVEPSSPTVTRIEVKFPSYRYIES